MSIGDKQIVTIEGKRHVCTVIFEGEFMNALNNWLDSGDVIRVDDTDLFVATLNRQPISDPLPMSAAFKALVDRTKIKRVA